MKKYFLKAGTLLNKDNMVNRILRKLTLTILIFCLISQVFAQTNLSEKELMKQKLERLLQLLPEEAAKFRSSLDMILAKQRQELASRDEITYYLLDTAVVYSVADNPCRYTYTYDEDGYNIITLIKKNQNNQWINVSFENIDYDEFKNPEIVTTKIWENNAWVNESRLSNSYFSNNLVEQAVVEVWEDEWVLVSRDSFNYFPGGAIASQHRETWDGEEWINFSNIVYIRDENELPLEIISQIWNGGSWENTSRLKYSYTNAGVNDSTYMMLWEENAWRDLYLIHNEYDNELKLTAVTDFFWMNESWSADKKEIYTYNEAGYLGVFIEQEWNEESWLNRFQSTYTYNEWGNEQSVLVENWQDNLWANYTLISWAFDVNGNALEGMVYSWQDGSWQHTQDALLNVYFDLGQNSEQFFGYSVELAYKSLIVSTPENREGMEFSIFPNPASSRFYLSVDQVDHSGSPIAIAIADLKGRVIMHNIFYSSP
ncbi:MAG TPA: hypothetical protein PLC47_03040, partial [Bacteroidales bacterium]|nr:hypothetical protein [Bacteroidales bacterium]